MTRRAARTASQLLALTRAQAAPPEGGEQRLIDLARRVPEMVAQRVHEAIRAGIDLGYEGGTPPLWVLGEPAGVQDLLDNLIDNAVRYAGHGSEITVRLRARDDGGASLLVEDNGPGVPPDLLPRLSERFFRVGASAEPGSGLGLAIVQHIAGRHGAELVFRNIEPHGLQVSVHFPPVSHAVDAPP